MSPNAEFIANSNFAIKRGLNLWFYWVMHVQSQKDQQKTTREEKD